jgi:hypothetical protein
MLARMTNNQDFRSLAEAYHAALADRVRKHLNSRGIVDEVIDRHLLGWTGGRITIPIPDRTGAITFFKLAKDPEDTSESPKMLTTAGSRAELYGWERVLANPQRLIICEGEFDRLVLESRGFPAVTSTGGAGTFRSEWADAIRRVPHVFLCFDNDEAGREGAWRVAGLIPHARAVEWPAGIGEGGDVTDFFVRMEGLNGQFEALLAHAKLLSVPIESVRPSAARSGANREAAAIRATVRIEGIIGQYVDLRRSGENFVGRCPFHEDHTPSLVVYLKTQTFHCFGCRAHGDVIAFLMLAEHLTFREALKVFRHAA